MLRHRQDLTPGVLSIRQVLRTSHSLRWTWAMAECSGGVAHWGSYMSQSKGVQAGEAAPRLQEEGELRMASHKVWEFLCSH